MRFAGFDGRYRSSQLEGTDGGDVWNQKVSYVRGQAQGHCPYIVYRYDCPWLPPLNRLHFIFNGIGTKILLMRPNDAAKCRPYRFK